MCPGNCPSAITSVAGQEHKHRQESFTFEVLQFAVPYTLCHQGHETQLRILWHPCKAKNNNANSSKS